MKWFARICVVVLSFLFKLKKELKMEKLKKNYAFKIH
jgi:hypothetical protein